MKQKLKCLNWLSKETLKGYPEDWIEKRMRGIAIREEITDEWKKRGAETNRDYEILTLLNNF